MRGTGTGKGWVRAGQVRAGQGRAVSVCWSDKTEGSTSCTYPERVRLVLWVRVENLAEERESVVKKKI